MFDIGYSELLIIGIVALVVIGPKDLPRVMRTVGNWIGRAQGMARHFRAGMETMMREAEMEEMEKKWRESNEQIMADNPSPAPSAPEGELPLPVPKPPESAAPSEDMTPPPDDEPRPLP